MRARAFVRFGRVSGTPLRRPLLSSVGGDRIAARFSVTVVPPKPDTVCFLVARARRRRTCGLSEISKTVLKRRVRRAAVVSIYNSRIPRFIRIRRYFFSPPQIVVGPFCTPNKRTPERRLRRAAAQLRLLAVVRAFPVCVYAIQPAPERAKNSATRNRTNERAISIGAPPPALSHAFAAYTHTPVIRRLFFYRFLRVRPAYSTPETTPHCRTITIYSPLRQSGARHEHVFSYVFANIFTYGYDTRTPSSFYVIRIYIYKSYTRRYADPKYSYAEKMIMARRVFDKFALFAIIIPRRDQRYRVVFQPAVAKRRCVRLLSGSRLKI